MASSSAYDEKLLSQAPEVTKADLQDGYNADLLRESTVKRASTTRAAPLRSDSATLHQHYPSHDKDLESPAAPLQPRDDIKYAELHQSSEPRRPWWRTARGIAIMAVVVIVIIIAAVLGGVLGSKKKSNNLASVIPGGAVQGGSVPSSVSSPSSTPSTSGAPSSSSGPSVNQGSSGNGAEKGSPPSTPLTQGSSGAGGPVSGSAPVASSPSVPAGAASDSNGPGENNGSNGVGRRAEALVAEVMLRDLGMQI